MKDLQARPCPSSCSLRHTRCTPSAAVPGALSDGRPALCRRHARVAGRQTLTPARRRSRGAASAIVAAIISRRRRNLRAGRRGASREALGTETSRGRHDRRPRQRLCRGGQANVGRVASTCSPPDRDLGVADDSVDGEIWPPSGGQAEHGPPLPRSCSPFRQARRDHERGRALRRSAHADALESWPTMAR